MKTLKNSNKLVIGSVLFGCLLVSCNASSATQLPLANQESNPRYTFPHNHTHASLWQDMSNRYALKDMANRNAEQRAEVQKQIKILQKNPQALYKKLKDAEPYISYIYHETQKRRLPAELALLPVVESGFNPHAKSHAGALGLWQIMPSTGTHLGLVDVKDYDSRKDVIASTDAALTYLAKLRQSFQNDWFIALAAYNWGPGNMKKTIKQGVKWYKRANYWELKMPQETKQYVPKLLALAEIIRNPAQYNMQLPVMTTKPVLASIQVKDRIDLKAVAKSSGIDMDTMKKLNPGYTKLATAKNAPNMLLVPAHKEREVLRVVKHPQRSGVMLAANKSNVAGQSQNDSADLLKAILKQGKWAVLALTNVPPASQG
ncbi:MAG: rane-bound lytic murein transglycosylase [Gammaproteobacteria bacterium]|jgi:membrane-bound lytic murein transglycosylase D|nr:rane-bound lytic murein transglycosylase [Gammaproteobacteria bacterium]